MRDSFCSSPWIHTRINSNGDFRSCRWASLTEKPLSIYDMSLKEYWNSAEMREYRIALLKGEKVKRCSPCYYEDEFGKINGRRKQLAKSAIDVKDFDNSLVASPHFNDFMFSYETEGRTTRLPGDLQIDVGNLCNAGCLFCSPDWSSYLQADFNKLDLEYTTPGPLWMQNKEKFNEFLSNLVQNDYLKYIHLLGGETLYIKQFYEIADHLIDHGKTDLILGTTTNGTIYNKDLERYITSFKNFHLNISIESFDLINDYVRYPGKVADIKENILKFVALRDKHPDKFVLTLQSTPSILTILHLDTIFEFLLEHNIIIESCNILFKPTCFKMEYLPEHLRKLAIAKLFAVIYKHDLVPPTMNTDNIRNSSIVREVISKEIFTYKTFLETYVKPDDAETERTNLVEYLHKFESLRHNSLRDYSPELATWLEEYGY